MKRFAVVKKLLYERSFAVKEVVMFELADKYDVVVQAMTNF